MSKRRLTPLCLAVLLGLPCLALGAAAAKPTISSISPTSVTAGSATFTLTVTGTNFGTGAALQWSGPSGSGSLSATVVSSTSLKANIPATLVTTAGTATLAVYVPGRQGGTTNSVAFTITPSSTTTTTTTGTTGSTGTTTYPLAITTTSIPMGTVGTAYSANLTASGGTAPYAWSVTSGALPPGLTLSSVGAISGTPTTSGSYAFAATVKDSASGTLSYTYSTSIGASLTPPLAITTTSPLPGATAGTAYSQTLAATGGTSPYSWTVASGSTLPAGLSLSTAGALTGTPTTAATYSFSIQAKDSANNTATQSYTYAVSAGTTTGIIWQTGFEPSDPTFDAINSYNPADVFITSTPPPGRSGNAVSINYRICGNPIMPPGPTAMVAGSLPQQTVYVKYTYVNSMGESGPSAEVMMTVPAGNVIHIPSPPPSFTQTAYNLYASLSSGAEVKQTATPIPLGTDWTEPIAGLVSGTNAPPTSNAGCGGASQDSNRWLSKVISTAMTHFFVRGYVYFKQPEGDAIATAQVQRKLIWLADSKYPTSNIDGNYQLILGSWMGTNNMIQPSLIGQFNPGGACPAVQWQTYNVGGNLAFNTWYEIELEIQLNTPGAADGIARVWVNGTQTYNNTAANLRGTCNTAISFFGLGEQANRYNYNPVNEFRYWDDFAISGSYIP